MPLACLILLGLLIGALPASAVSATGRVVVLDVKGVIGPATSDYVHRGLAKVVERGASIVVIRMDTPGGLDTAMRAIIQDIINSPIPIATFVSPGGARAASAGTYILYASHIAAMAPGTNLGAATPVQIATPLSPGGGQPDEDKKDPGDAMTRKILNDAVAYIQGLARLRGRNAQWAEKAVREAASLTAQDAVEQGVIDLVAKDVPDLLEKLDGRKVNVAGNDRILRTADLPIEYLAPDWRSRLLAVISDPNVAYILMLVGIYGLIYEFANPGMVLPGVVGAICLVLALFAFQVLPINYTGLGLIILGIAFMITEVFAPSFGALGVGGVIAFIIGSVILMESDVPGFAISWVLIGAFSLISAGFFIAVVGMALKARRRPVVSGREEMIGGIGEAIEDFDARGHIRVHGETWEARTEAPLKRGQTVRVVGMRGLMLLVEPWANGNTEDT